MRRIGPLPWLMAAMAVVYTAYCWYFPIDYLPDTNTYIFPARAILEGSYDSIYRVPVYPMFLAAWMALGLNTDQIVIVQHVIAWLTIALLYWAVLPGLGRRGALFVALIYGISPVWLSLQHMIFSEALFVPLSVLCLTIALRGKLAQGPLGLTALLAVLMMISALTRPIYLSFVACMPLLYLLFRNEPLKNRLAHAVVFCAVCAAMVMPWMLRQSDEQTDFFTPIAARNLPINAVMLIDPKMPSSDEGARDFAVENFRTRGYAKDGWTSGERNDAMLLLFNELGTAFEVDEPEVNRMLTRLALEGIAYKPLGYAKVALINFLTLMLTVPAMALLFLAPLLIACRREQRPSFSAGQMLYLKAHVLVLAVVTALFEVGMPRYSLTFWVALCVLFVAAARLVQARYRPAEGSKAERSGST
ncbi:MAG: glycosyltransferase family 39 protein [Candidatus Alcyoniella australis]|nr:glycosyltransferase family 39 protein [Candidatus Alcyoniella australis]